MPRRSGSRRRRRRRKAKSEPCQYTSCNRVAEVFVEIGGRRYHICIHHYMEIVKKVQLLASKKGEANMEDLKIHTRRGKITRVVVGAKEGAINRGGSG